MRIGTSGWSYRHWRGTFYPQGLPVARWLEHYAQVFDCVEVNGSFYRLPKRSTFIDWAARTPSEFRFAVKGSRFITHYKRLREPREHVERFFDAATGLGEKLGPVLWQLPPDFARDDHVLDEFLEHLPRFSLNTFEFRHESWLVEPIFEMLRRHGVSLCIPDHPKMPIAPALTAPWMYIRFHYGRSSDGDYPEEALRRWAGWIEALPETDQPSWAFFNNDWQTYAPSNAVTLRNQLRGSQGLSLEAGLGSTTR